MEEGGTGRQLDAVVRRLDAVERRLAELEGGSPDPTSASGAAAAGSARPEAPESESPVGPDSLSGAGGRLVIGAGSTEGDDTFWILNGLRSRLAGDGGVAFAGTVRVADGPVEWQLGATTEDVLSADWSVLAADLAALGHPTRLTLLQAILGGVHTVAELSAVEGIGSTGQLYHHLGQLSGHGWLNTVARGRYVVPAQRIVPLMVIMTATRRIG